MTLMKPTLTAAGSGPPMFDRWRWGFRMLYHDLLSLLIILICPKRDTE